MTESDVITLVRKILRKELVPTLMGVLVSNQDQLRITMQRFASEGSIPNLRNIQPFGVASRAPAGTALLVSPVGNDPSHLNVIGAFDANRPSLEDGESMLYDAYGHIVYLSQSKMQFGSKSSSENMVLGQVFKTMMDTLLTAIATHTHIGNLGYQTTPPDNAADFTNLKASPIDDDAILSDKAFTEK